MMQAENIVGIVQKFTGNLLAEKLLPHLTFHNVRHTFEVWQNVQMIGAHCNISKYDLCVLEVAALFHDCGYTRTYIGHEEVSKEIAQQFLKQQNCSKEFIEEIIDLIQSTKFPQKPATLTAKILCDADMYHLTKPDYPIYAEALRKEQEIYFNRIFSIRQWAALNYELLICHKYFTDYGKSVLQYLKAINIERIKSYLKMIN